MAVSPVRAFILDMDGTLIDNMLYHNEAWMALLKSQGASTDPEEFLRETSGRTTPEILRTYLRPDLTGEEIAALMHKKESLYREIYLPHRRLVEGVDEMIETARGAGIKLAVATAAPRPNVEYILDGLDLRRHFDVVTGVEDITRGKPDPEIFLKTAARLGVEPEACVVFEDAVMGIEAARRAGMRVVAILTMISEEEARRMPQVEQWARDFRGIDLAALVNGGPGEESR